MQKVLTQSLMTINLCKMILNHADHPQSMIPPDLVRYAEATMQACAESEGDVVLMAMAHRQLPCLRLMEVK